MPKLEMIGLLDIKGQDSIRRVYDPDWYWAASVGSGNSANCVSVGDNGHSNHWNASCELYVPVCFVIQ